MLTVEIDLDEVYRSMDEAIRRGHSLGPIFRDIKGPLKVDQQEHAKDRAGPDGAWPPRAAATLAKLRANGRRARRPMGRLTSSVKYRSTATGAIGESPVAWSGGAISKGGKVGHGATLPARQFLYASDQLLRFAGEMILDFIFDRWGG